MNSIKAQIISAKAPSKAQEKRFQAFLLKKYGKDFELEWVLDENIKNGFKLEVNGEVYDWTKEGRFSQLQETLSDLKLTKDFVPLLKEAIGSFVPKALSKEVGTVLTVGDGIAQVGGLEKATYGEILIFQDGVRGMVQELSDNVLGCMLFGDDELVSAGSEVRRTGKTAGINVGNDLLGRVVNALGAPIDGKGDIQVEDYYPIEREAPGIIDRQPVNKPIETGILSIDSMFPIGRGQRELIIGDRQTGKTAIAIDTIINQKGKDIVCVYVAIGQKASSVAQIREKLISHGAMDYTVIVNASASEPAPFLYLAPYSGCAIAEYFMAQGRDVLIIYDDLTKHATAYRTISLLLERAPGREAYPGDVFYLHSRLLERSAHLSDEKGGGSITALPIAETQNGDVSSYIPTNIISITDGQIFLETDLFLSGQRPAVNVGLSVSRVGSQAQYKAIKKASGALRLSLAQYREMEVFTQFASDLDDTTKAQLKFGGGLMRILRQEQYSPYKLHEQVILLVTSLNHLLQEVEINEVSKFTKGMLDYFHSNYDTLCKRIDQTHDLTQEDREKIVEIGQEYLGKYVSNKGN